MFINCELPKILTNSYYSNYYTFFESIKNKNHDFFETVTQTVAWTQIFFQLIMVPVSFLKYGFLIVRIWGIAFSFISIFLFQISLLPYFYMLIWMLTIYLSKDYKLNYNILKNSLKLKRYKIVYLLILIFSLSSLSLFFKSKKFDEVDSKLVNHNSLLEKNLTEKYILELSKYFGLITPNVFNSHDILSDTKWVVIYNILNTKRNLIPFVDTDGKRLSYHSNDIIYYKDSIPIRRCLLENNLEETIEHLIKVSSYHNRKCKKTKSKLYEFVFYNHEVLNKHNTQKKAFLSPVLSKTIDISPYL